MNLYGGGFRLYCCASFFSLFIFISLNRASASNKAEDTQNPQNQFGILPLTRRYARKTSFSQLLRRGGSRAPFLKTLPMPVLWYLLPLSPSMYGKTRPWWVQK